ncbi:MAG: putative bifunctional diguanylate cyclase/phosphodiesterase [Chitinispirillaceae bacterium]
MKKAQKTRQQLALELKQVKNQLQKSKKSPKCTESVNEKLLLGDIIFENAAEGIIITDPQGMILKINPGFTYITGYQSEEVLGNTPALLKSDRHGSAFYKKLWNSLKTNGTWQGEIWNRRKNGEIYPEWLVINSLRDEENKTTHYIGIFTDITRSLRNENEIQRRAYYDSLTGLPNRILLQDRLTFMINHARRNKQLMALLLLDLNRFKLINDTLGYQIGDALLQTVAERLQTCIRDVDAVFRLGDDEFAIILEEIAQQQDAARVAKRILASCAMPVHLGDHEIYATTSIGISIFPTDGEGLESILKNAEAAMHRAKEMGINNYQHYMPAMNSRAFEQLTLEHNLRKALKRNELVTFYQPQLDLATGKISGMEALIRWRHPELGMISPGQFIPIAEETGLILPIGEWVLRTACKQAKAWQKDYGNLVISVNLSARQFLQQDLVSIVDSALKEAELAPEYLELEITESLGMQNPEQTLKTLGELKAMGIRIAIDDFGTGYSSLSYLKRFPIDTLKVDRSFVTDMPGDANDAAIAAAIVALAHSLRLTVIAEGVENEAQAEYLLELGCEKVQGYLYSPPVDAISFAKILVKEENITTNC